MGFEGGERRTWSFVDGDWVEGDPPMLSIMSIGHWLAASVFDGARAVGGKAPDLLRHCERLVASGRHLGLASPHGPERVAELLMDGVARFPADAALYLRPTLWADHGFVAPDPASTRYAYTVFEAPLPAFEGIAVTLAQERRPGPEVAPTAAKAAALYPQAGVALARARALGFDNAVMLDPLGNVAELTSANVWGVRGGVAFTPAPNGTFLDGITRQRVAALLRGAGVEVQERRVAYDDLLDADELFLTGNHAKVLPIVRIETQLKPLGPVTQLARDEYFTWAGWA